MYRHVVPNTTRHVATCQEGVTVALPVVFTVTTAGVFSAAGGGGQLEDAGGPTVISVLNCWGFPLLALASGLFCTDSHPETYKKARNGL